MYNLIMRKIIVYQNIAIKTEENDNEYLMKNVGLI